MNDPALLVLDQGTSSTKAFLFSRDFELLHRERIRHKISRPRPGWAEIDARKILETCQSLIASLLKVCESNSLIPGGLGIAFQRSTFLFWHKKSGQPLTPALSWQDNRANELTATMSEHKDWIQQTTGIPLSPHFGGPKLLFFLRNDPSLRTEVRSRNVWFGPLSAFVTQGLTGNSFMDESIAGRTLLLNLREMAWDSSLLHLFEVPEDCLPPLAPTCGQFGTIRMASKTVPLLCVMGDQQASLVGMDRGNVALNLGTSGSVLMHSGEHPTVVPTLLSNVLYSRGQERYFLLEGTINSVSTLFGWLESYLHIPHKEMRWEERCVQSTKGIFVPGIDGMAAPYWTGELDNAFFDLEDSDGQNAFVRAAMESVGFLVRDIFDVMQDKVGIDPEGIIASGGYSKPVLLQFIADLLNKPIWSSRERDMTALGVAKLVAGQLWNIPADEPDEIRQERFVPIMSSQERHQKISRWRDALRQLGVLKNPSDQIGG